MQLLQQALYQLVLLLEQRDQKGLNKIFVIDPKKLKAITEGMTLENLYQSCCNIRELFTVEKQENLGELVDDLNNLEQLILAFLAILGSLRILEIWKESCRDFEFDFQHYLGYVEGRLQVIKALNLCK